MPAPRARSSTEMPESGRSPSSRSAVARMASSRSSPEGRAVRRPRAPGRVPVGKAIITAPYPGRDRFLNMLLTASTYRRYGALVAVQPIQQPSESTADPGSGAAPERVEHVDVLIVGAGLSGIGAACHLRDECPGKTYAVLEARAAIGGTWDLFRSPGVRSDSDMFTLGYGFRPWTDAKAIADGPSIRRYIEETAREYGVREHI